MTEQEAYRAAVSVCTRGIFPPGKEAVLVLQRVFSSRGGIDNGRFTGIDNGLFTGIDNGLCNGIDNGLFTTVLIMVFYGAGSAAVANAGFAPAASAPRRGEPSLIRNHPPP